MEEFIKRIKVYSITFYNFAEITLINELYYGKIQTHFVKA